MTFDRRYSLIVLLIVSIICILSIIQFEKTFFLAHKNAEQEQVKGTVVTSKTISALKDKNQIHSTQAISADIIEDGTLKRITLSYNADSLSTNMLRPGDQIVLTKTITPEGTTYHFSSLYRISRLFIVISGFILFILLLAGKRGIGAVLGLIVSIIIIAYYMIPQILAGKDPLMVSIIAAIGIMFVSIYLAHGISKQTTIAVGATGIALVVSFVLAKLLTSYVFLTGFGTEEAFTLFQVHDVLINMKAVLIGGIVISTLGALDDITTAQSAAVFALARANRRLSFRELMERSFTIGREHVLSLVNTLIIAYVGSSFLVFLSYFVFFANQPFFSVLNREPMVEEIVKAIAISSGLLSALPIVTVLAAYVARKESIAQHDKKPEDKK